MMANDIKRVVITGIGAVSGCGIGCEPLWAHLSTGTPAFSNVQRSFGNKVFNITASLVPGYDPSQHFNTSALALADPFAQYAALASREAMKDAGLIVPLVHPHRCAIILGSGEGGGQTREDAFMRMFHLDKRLHPMTVPRINHQAGVALISAEFGITGPCFTIATACASAAHAIAQAWLMVRTGMVDMAITGGSDAGIFFGLINGFDALRVVSDKPCSPFSLGRNGMSFGEGAGIVVIESEASALARNAHTYAALAGVGMTSDALNSLHPTVDGPATAMQLAMQTAGLITTDIGYINAHGTGTIANDAVESAAIHKTFHGAPPLVSSTKSIHGHTLGAAGGIELVATVLALKHQLIPPTANFIAPDPACPVDCVPNTPRKHTFHAALSNSFAFGGLNVSLAIKSNN